MADDRFHRDARTAELQVSLHNSHKNNKKKNSFCSKTKQSIFKMFKVSKTEKRTSNRTKHISRLHVSIFMSL